VSSPRFDYTLEEVEQEGFRPGVMVRSYDFKFSRECWIEGEIIEIAPWSRCGCGQIHFHIRPTRQVIPCQCSLDRRPTCPRCQGTNQVVEDDPSRLPEMIYPAVEVFNEWLDYGRQIQILLPLRVLNYPLGIS